MVIATSGTSIYFFSGENDKFKDFFYKYRNKPELVNIIILA